MVWGQVDTNEFTWKQASQFLDVGEAATAVDALPYKANDERLSILFYLIYLYSYLY